MRLKELAKPTIDDVELMALIGLGVIILTDLESAHPRLTVAGRIVKPHLNEQGGRNRIYGGKRWRWKIQYKGACRRIVCSKLVWMFVEKRIIPEDHIIHHGRLGSQFDGYPNLKLVSYAEHQQIHYG